MVSAVIVAAGLGKRMGGGVDKLFLSIAGRPVVGHTWTRFDQHPEIDEVILVVRAEREREFTDLGSSLGLSKPFRFAVGGKERQDSVWNGLQAVAPDCDVVLVQDGARPCTPADVISATLDAARETGAAVAAQRVVDTIKESADGQTISRTVDRAKLWSVQTPQSFQPAVLRRALEAVREAGIVVTDDTAACELIGQPVRLVASVQPNPKVTAPSDLAYIELLLRAE